MNKPCVICNKELCSIIKDDWTTLQPNDGCEITILGTYGSSKFDGYKLRGIICDECVEELQTKMLKTYTGI
jgi:hypothetical protein